MAQSRNDSISATPMQQPQQQIIQNIPTQRYDLTQPPMMSSAPNNGMSNLLEPNSDNRQNVSL
jgi:hypothetical protein